MPRYRRIPTEIDAIIFDSKKFLKDNSGEAVEISEEELRFFSKITFVGHEKSYTGHFQLDSGFAYGSMTLKDGDYIIRTEKGDHYVVKADVFSEVYELVK